MFAALLGALGSMVVGLYTGNKAVNAGTKLAEEWFKFTASLIGSALVTFPAIWGGTIAPTLVSSYNKGDNVWVVLGSCVLAVTLGFAAAMISTSAVLAVLWTRSPLTRGIPICWPMSVSQEVLKGGFSFIVPADNAVKK